MLEKVNCPEDLKNLSNTELEQLAGEIREFLIEKVSKTGGHLSSNLGVVELTLALCRDFSFPEDKIVFDVGHQSYVYKILTGRKEGFDHLRTLGGLSGFPKTSESPYDSVDTGHASTSIGAALGLAKARDMRNEKHRVVAVIGDGALTGGMAYEAMNMAGRSQSPLIVILNDNEMSIGPNVGALSRRLSSLRSGNSYLNLKRHIHSLVDPKDGSEGKTTAFIRKLKRRIKYFLLGGVFFEELGMTYLGPVDGHDLNALHQVLEQAKRLNEPVLVHVKTIKGKGYKYAEEDSTAFHGVGRFDPDTGMPRSSSGLLWCHAVGDFLTETTKADPCNAVITAAMPQGTGTYEYGRAFPDHFYDVGICEEQAVTFASGLARGGIRPWVVLYSTFLQRSYDQVVHDVCLENLPVRFLIDHAGIVGEDGETHQGIFDIAFMGHIPQMELFSPSTKEELEKMLQAMSQADHPTAIRYPKGKVLLEEELRSLVLKMEKKADKNIRYQDGTRIPLEKGKGFFRLTQSGSRICILALGVMVQNALQAASLLAEEKIPVDVADARYATRPDPEWIRELETRYDRIITVEDHIHEDGFGMFVKDRMQDNGKIRILALPDQFIPQGKREELIAIYGLDAASIAAGCKESLKEKTDKTQKDE